MADGQRNGTAAAAPRSTWRRWEPLSGAAFFVLFVVGIMMTNIPNANASDQSWHNYFASSGNRADVLVSGYLLVASAICLVAFLTCVWMRIAERRRPEPISPLPLVAAAVAGASIAIGAVCLAVIPGSMIFGSLPEPGVDTLRLTVNAAYPFIMVAGMFGTALSIGALSIQAHAAGLFGRPMIAAGLVAALGGLLGVFFYPMVVVVAWALAATVVLVRQSEAPQVPEVPGARLSGTPTARTPTAGAAAG